MIDFTLFFPVKLGTAPIWDCEQLRCATCGKVYTARAPEQAQGPKYDETALSMTAVLRYGTGMPFHRMDRLQRDLETPVPASTQWDVVKERVEMVRPAYEELVRLAAQGSVLHNDDSYMRVLSFMGKRRAALLKKGELPDPERTGLFTTAIVSIDDARPAITLFFTGRKHAGENLEDVLDQRSDGLPPPIQMGDALTRNVPDKHTVVESNCLAHGRRKIFDERHNYPTECRDLLEKLSRVYEVDDLCRERELSPLARLEEHKRESGPLMDEIKRSMEEQIAQKRVEPNSGIGEAFHYFLKRWDKFTLFLREPAAPLDNNICERALKKAIQHRKGSLFYRSERGAGVGDIYMSLIYTAELHGDNPFDYLTALQRHHKAVAEKPAEWLPWNYEETLARMGVRDPPVPAPAARPRRARRPPRTSRSSRQRERPPLGRGLTRLRVAARQEHRELVREQVPTCLPRRARPVAEPPMRHPLLAEPEALAVVRQDLDRRPAAVAEHEDRSRERVLRQALAAEPAEPVDSPAEVHRLHGDQDPHLRGQLDHDSWLQNACTSPTTSTPLVPFTSIRMRPPRCPTISTTVLPLAPASWLGPSSTNAATSLLSLRPLLFLLSESSMRPLRR